MEALPRPPDVGGGCVHLLVNGGCLVKVVDILLLVVVEVVVSPS